jgi:hypothetical protein
MILSLIAFLAWVALLLMFAVAAATWALRSRLKALSAH